MIPLRLLRLTESTAVETVAAVAKVSPPAYVTTLLVFGEPVKLAAIVLTAIYTALMTAHLLWRWRREYLKAAAEDAQP